MGQYQQWLHYRHIDQQLQTHKDQLTTAIKHLQEHINTLNALPLDAENTVMQALTFYMKSASASDQASSPEQALANGHMQQPETISQALFDHSRLEPLSVQHIHKTNLPKGPTNAYTPLPLIPHEAVDLIPEANTTSSDEQGQTQPQVALPWWLRKAALAEGEDSTLDAQSIRTNRLVQRWLERWGRQEEHESESTPTNGQQMDSQQEGI